MEIYTLAANLDLFIINKLYDEFIGRNIYVYIYILYIYVHFLALIDRVSLQNHLNSKSHTS